MSLQNRIKERIRSSSEEAPTLPEINNENASIAQEELNNLLKREDVVSNADPSNEGDILTIFIHGYLASKWLWIDPYFGSFGWLRDHKNEPKPRNYGWHPTPPPSYMFVPFDVSISPTVYPEGPFHTLMREGYELLTYSQKDVAGDINISVKELELVIKGIQKIYGNRRLVLVGHSRGGLCIRKYLDTNTNSEVEKIITLSTPHDGSHLTNLKIIKEPAIHILNDSIVKGIWDISGKREIRNISYDQMQPESEFLLNLKDREKSKDIEYITVGGTNPNYTHVYTWSVSHKITKNQLKDIFSYQVKETTQKIAEKIEKVVPSKKNKRKEKTQAPKQFQWIAYPKKVLTIFEKLPTPEIRNGDGLVALQSATLKDATRKYKLDANHEEMAVCEDTKKLLLKELNLTRKK